MAFMQAQMTDKQAWHEIDGDVGTFWFPAADFTLVQAIENYEGKVSSVREARTITGYGVRCSAPGYMDCTDWEVYTTESDAYDRFCELDADLHEDDEENVA